MDDEWKQWVKMGVLKLVSSDDKFTTKQQESIYNVQQHCSPNFQNSFPVAWQPNVAEQEAVSNMVDTSLHPSFDFGSDEAQWLSGEAMDKLIQEYSTEADGSIDMHNKNTPDIPVCNFLSVSAIW